MSTRSTTHFVSSYQGVERTDAIVYRHSDGYPSGAGADLLKFFEEVAAQTKDTRFSDPNYLAAKYVVFLAREFCQTYERDDLTGGYKYVEHFNERPFDFISVGVMMEDPGDIEYRYIVDCSHHDEDGRPQVYVVDVGYGDMPDSPRVPVLDAIQAEKAANAL